MHVLHGDADDNVLVTEARRMRKLLGEFHPDLRYYEKPGAGHWWSNEAVDYAPLFEFMRQHVRPRPEDVRHIEFHTANPHVSAQADWIAVEQQLHCGEFSTVTADFDPNARTFTIKTENVRRLSVLPRAAGMSLNTSDGPITIVVDGQSCTAMPDSTSSSMPTPFPSECGLQLDGEVWKTVLGGIAGKGRHQYGPFKHVFDERVAFVYGTQGTPEENAALYAKARYDAEVFWYRGNAAADVFADTDFVTRAADDSDRNILLYGNADTNAAWGVLMHDSPVQVHRGGVQVGDREIRGGDLGALVVRPRPIGFTEDGFTVHVARSCLVAAVAGTGLQGQRLLDRLPLFVTGIAYPDLFVIGPEVLTSGNSGIRAAGFFGMDWSLENGEIVWSQP